LLQISAIRDAIAIDVAGSITIDKDSIYHPNCIGDIGFTHKMFEKSLEIDPRYAIGYRTIAWLKDWQGDSEDALDWEKCALELAPINKLYRLTNR
jgi:tetratricopeptide (TPR) repeat protein